MGIVLCTAEVSIVSKPDQVRNKEQGEEIPCSVLQPEGDVGLPGFRAILLLSLVLCFAISLLKSPKILAQTRLYTKEGNLNFPSCSVEGCCQPEGIATALTYRPNDLHCSRHQMLDKTCPVQKATLELYFCAVFCVRLGLTLRRSGRA